MDKYYFIIKRKLIFDLFPFILLFGVALITDYDNREFFEDMSFYKPFLFAALGCYFIFTFVVTKIIIKDDFLIFDYYIWFKWRKKDVQINNIKSIKYYCSSSPEMIEIETYKPLRRYSFIAFGFDSKLIRELIERVISHPQSRIESNLE